MDRLRSLLVLKIQNSVNNPTTRVFKGKPVSPAEAGVAIELFEIEKKSCFQTDKR